jgi:transcriptional regulator with XRE-family HTH domain
MSIEKKMASFLLAARTSAELSQAEVALRSQVYGQGTLLDQKAVSRIESTPLNVDALKIAAYFNAVGLKPEEYFKKLSELTKPEGTIEMISNYDIDFLEQIEKAKNKIAKAKKVISNQSHKYLDNENLGDFFTSADSSISSLVRKPIIGCFGLFDTGKSTILNTLIGQDVLPEKFQPATSVVNLIAHIKDKPESINENVAIFSKGFKPHMISSKSLVEKYLIEQGTIDLLKKYGAHDHFSSPDSETKENAYLAMVYLNSDILENIWLLDTPGELNSEDSEDTDKALSGVELADGIIYVSKSMGFLDRSELGFAQNILRNRPPLKGNDPLKHIIFAMSYCVDGFDAKTNIEAGRTAFKRHEKTFEQEVFSHWKEDGFCEVTPDTDNLTHCLQPFWRENKSYVEELFIKVQEMANYLKVNQRELALSYIEQTMKRLTTILTGSISKMDKRKEDTLKRSQEVADLENRFRDESKKIVMSFEKLIDSSDDYKNNDLEDIKSFYNSVTSEHGVLSIIKDNFSDKKSAEASIGDVVSQKLTAKLERIMKNSGKAYNAELSTLLSQWQNIVPNYQFDNANGSSTIGTISGEFSGFDSNSAFIGGLGGLASLGAMSLYVSTIASNLGAYILVGKAAGVLTSLGITSSVTTLTSFVAAIGGPITIGVVLAGAIGYAIYRIAGGKWEDALAKKVAKAISKSSSESEIESNINAFWDSTKLAMKKGLEELIKQTECHIDEMKKEAATDYEPQELDIVIGILNQSVDQLNGENECLAA